MMYLCVDFQQYLDLDVTLPVDKVQQLTDCCVGKVNCIAARLKKIFLVEDLIDSLKFAAGTEGRKKQGPMLKP
jgi:hypothetical protein